MKLSQNFSLAEFTRSATAQHLGISNQPSDTAIVNLLNLCQRVLQPLRDHVGLPINISSGYRNDALNKAVGGVANSQHRLGEAADIVIPTRNGQPDLDTAREWMQYISGHLIFDQIILEHNADGHYWLHVSCRRDVQQNRHCLIRSMLKA